MKPDAPPEVVDLLSGDLQRMSKVERLKAESQGLFRVAGRQPRALADEIDALTRGEADTISGDAKEIAKFHGIYKQQEREAGRKTGSHIFMVRLKLPAGGELSPEQWRALDDGADRFANGTLRLTTRQGVQLHYVHGKNLGPLVRHIGARYADRGYRMTTLGACGDVNRNTMCSPIDDLDPELPLRSRELAHEIATELAPRAGGEAYCKIFLCDEEGRNVAPMTSEPVYGTQYLPRKFKVAIAHPRDNSVDLLTQDVGFLPVASDGKAGEEYDVYSGGGLGITHNQPHTRQHLGLYLGRVPRAHVVATTRAIALLQRDHGERRDRRQARWKYTIRRLGLEAVRGALRERFDVDLRDAEPQPIPPIRFFHGWSREVGERWMLVLPIENGRLADRDGVRTRSAVRRIIEELRCGVRVTPAQDLLLCHLDDAGRARADALLREHGVPDAMAISHVRRQAFACPAKPTCGLAMTDAEGILPRYVEALEAAGLGDVDVQIRMAGCPNSCSRPPTAEIGIYGYGKNDHVIQVGGAANGTRIGRVLYERVPGDRMIEVLTGLLRAIRDRDTEGLGAGDFLDQTSDARLREWVGVEL